MRLLLRWTLGLGALLLLGGFVMLRMPSPQGAPTPTTTGDPTSTRVLGAQITRPGTAAQTGPRTHEVASLSAWNAAVAAAQPGDTIRLTATINASLVYRGPRDAAPVGRSGTAGAPITITAAPNVWIDPGNMGGNVVGLDVLRADHIHVVGVRIRNAQFGLRLQNVMGSAEAPVRVRGNIVSRTGHAGLIVQGDASKRTISQHVLVENNEVFDTGQSTAGYGEGIYLGFGGVEWQDETSNITIRNNNIYRVGAEGVDIKPGTREIVVEGNLIHDLAPISGGAISAHYVGVIVNPKPGELDRVVIRSNRIWNQNLSGVAGANDWAIWVGHGGVEIIDNRIWGMRNDAGRTRAVRIRALKDFGPHPIVIRGNTFWTASGWVAEGSPSGAALVQASGNLAPAAAGGTTVVGAGAFVGPVPALGQAGTADRGQGPGSGFDRSGVVPAQTATSQAATATTAPRAATTATTAPRPATTPTTAPRAPTTAPRAATTATTAARAATTAPAAANAATTAIAVNSPATARFQGLSASSAVGNALSIDVVSSSTSGAADAVDEATSTSAASPDSIAVPSQSGAEPDVGEGDAATPSSDEAAGAAADDEAPDTLAFTDTPPQLQGFTRRDVGVVVLALGGLILGASVFSLAYLGLSGQGRIGG